ncbi:alpha/beta hydrolase [Burkholderia gladioli]|jgi:hypothetical protein|uniref:alpha/beta hydrolase n=1 Tax=Burkholderia gladioli TaxID=28095 RepID=UPI00163E893D|nr:alpha/beta hydrolase [Burkholderia gladioli]
MLRTSPYRLRAGLVVAFVSATLAALAQPPGDASARRQATRLDAPVKAVAPQRLHIDTAQGSGELPVYANRDLEAPAPDVTRVLIVLHGTLRNADVYEATGQQVIAQAGEAGQHVLVVAPQFLTRADARAFDLPPRTLAWSQRGWKAGEAARQPAPLGSMAVLDALLARFADRRRYPALGSVVVAGHSAGAQLLQRYAVVGHGDEALARLGVAVRYVVANPSSYLYFNGRRPAAASVPLADCEGVNRWKYGFDGAPPYVTAQGKADFERRYVARDVVYLLGTADTDPATHFIDRSCAAMTQGPNRLARGLAYFDYLRARHPSDFTQTLVEVPGVGHDNLRMFTSECGTAVLLGQPIPASCPAMGGQG